MAALPVRGWEVWFSVQNFLWYLACWLVGVRLSVESTARVSSVTSSYCHFLHFQLDQVLEIGKQDSWGFNPPHSVSGFVFFITCSVSNPSSLCSPSTALPCPTASSPLYLPFCLLPVGMGWGAGNGGGKSLSQRRADSWEQGLSVCRSLKICTQTTWRFCICCIILPFTFLGQIVNDEILKNSEKECYAQIIVACQNHV